MWPAATVSPRASESMRSELEGHRHDAGSSGVDGCSTDRPCHGHAQPEFRAVADSPRSRWYVRYRRPR
jgi:hypothetical protein